jgi:hypothetical protein
MQSTLPLRRRASAQCCLTSALHTFAAVAVNANQFWHGAERSLTCSFKHAPMRTRSYACAMRCDIGDAWSYSTLRHSGRPEAFRPSTLPSHLVV